MLQSFGNGAIEISEQSRHFIVGDQPGFATLRVLWNVPAWIGAVLAKSPDFGHVEHLAKAGEDTIGSHRCFLHPSDEGRHVRPSDVANLEAPEVRNDVTVDVALVAFDGPWPILRLRVIFNEFSTQLLHARSGAHSRFLSAWVFASADVGKPILGDRASLLDGELAELANRGLPAIARIGAILKHEDLSASRSHFQEKPGHHCVAQFVRLGAERCGVHRDLREFDLGHPSSPSLPISRSQLGATRKAVAS